MEREEDEPVALPFPAALVRRVTRQSLTIFPHGKDPIQRGMSRKAAALLSLATGIFLKNLAPKVMEQCSEKAIKRKNIVETIYKEQRLLFTVTRLRPDEIFQSFVEENELSRRIGMSNIERTISFPIEFVAPNPVGHSYILDENETLNREKQNVDEAVRAIVMAHHAYRQRVPDFFKPDQYAVKRQNV